VSADAVLGLRVTVRVRVRVRLRLRVNPNPHPNQVLGEAEQLQVLQRVKLLAHKLAISPYISLYLPISP